MKTTTIKALEKQGCLAKVFYIAMEKNEYILLVEDRGIRYRIIGPSGTDLIAKSINQAREWLKYVAIDKHYLVTPSVVEPDATKENVDLAEEKYVVFH